MKKPKSLRRGDTVAVVSLSSGMAGEPQFKRRFERGLERVGSEFGLKTKVMPNAQKGIDYVYSHPEVRAADWMAALKDDSVSGIFCAIGGDDSVRLLPHVDFDVIAQNPKVFLGYSDTTACHFMNLYAGVVSYHGPSVLSEFAENVAMHDYTKYYLEKTLFSPPETLEIKPSEMWTSEYLEWADPKNDDTPRKLLLDTHGGFVLLQGEGQAEGELMGGNLGVMQMIVGTRIWPNLDDWRGKLLVVETAEDVPPPESLLYALRNFAAQGILDVINGVVVGKPYDEKHFDDYAEIWRAVIGREVGRPELPILYNVNCSHTAPVCVLPLGARAAIDCENNSLALLEPATAFSR